MANIRTFFANAYETTITVELGPSGLEVTPATTDGAPATPCYLVLEPDDAGQREYFLASSIAGGTITISAIGDRYLAQSAAASGLTHPVGSVLKQAPVAQMFTDVHDRIESRLASSAHTLTLHNDLGIAHSSLGGLTTGDPHTQYLNLARHDTIARHGSSVVDHGQIGGLGDDDHPQYLRTDGSRAVNNQYVGSLHSGLAFGAALTGGLFVLDFANSFNLYHLFISSSPFEISTSNLAPGRWRSINISNSSVADAVLTFPAGWKWVGELPPETLDIGEEIVLSLTCFRGGTSDSGVRAAWAPVVSA